MTRYNFLFDPAGDDRLCFRRFSSRRSTRRFELVTKDHGRPSTEIEALVELTGYSDVSDGLREYELASSRPTPTVLDHHYISTIVNKYGKSLSLYRNGTIFDCVGNPYFGKIAGYRSM